MECIIELFSNYHLSFGLLRFQMSGLALKRNLTSISKLLYKQYIGASNWDELVFSHNSFTPTSCNTTNSNIKPISLYQFPRHSPILVEYREEINIYDIPYIVS